MRWTLRDKWASHQSYLAVSRRKHGPSVVDQDTRLVIEGFPRAANTFTVFAFQMAQPAPVRVAHHLHAPIQVIAAVRARIPVVLLVRPPEEAVLSLAMWSPYVSLDRALAAYCRFYEHVQPCSSWCVIGEFRQVTTDLGRVVDTVNRRYGTSFSRFEHTSENVQACYRLIEEMSRRPPWAAAITRYVSGTITAEQLAAARTSAWGDRQLAALVETRVARPSPVRTAHREQIRGQYHHPRLAPMRDRAERAYRAVTDG